MVDSGVGAAMANSCQHNGAMTAARNAQVFLRPRWFNPKSAADVVAVRAPPSSALGCRAWSWRGVAFLLGGDGVRRSHEHLAMAGRNLWLLGIWLEHVLKKIPLHERYKEFTYELTNVHVPELCLER
jgi:hypothetical protein